MRRRGALTVVALVASLSAGLPTFAAEPGPDRVLIVNRLGTSYPGASRDRGVQIEMLVRHFTPNTKVVTVVDDEDLRDSDFVIVIGNDADDRIDDKLAAAFRELRLPTLWVGYGLERASADPDRLFGFAPGYVSTSPPVEAVQYRGQTYPTTMDEYHQVRIANPGVDVLAWVIAGGQRIPLAVRSGNLWFFGALPGLDTDYPDPAVDAPNLVFADLLHDFFGNTRHDPRQAIIRLEDISVHIPPERVIAAVDALASRHIPFVIGVIPAQRLSDGSVVSLEERPDFVQALRYAQSRGGTVALHGYHHTFGQGEDFEFWDPDRHAPIEGETWDSYAVKLEDGLRVLRDQGLDPQLWETPHYAASPLGYRVFARYFSHAIENRDPVAWLPYPAGPDPYGQVLIPENIGYINESAGWTVEAQLARASLLGIVRDATAVGFYHPASIPVSDLERLFDGLRSLGYSFEDVRNLRPEVRFDYSPDMGQTAGNAVRLEPGIAALEATDLLFGFLGARRGAISGVALVVLFCLFGLVFLVRLRAQWRSGNVQRSRVQKPGGRKPVRRIATVAIAAGTVAVVVGLRLSGISPSSTPTVPAQIEDARIEEPLTRPPVTSGGWEISVYFTPVERYYHGAKVVLRGCLVIDCHRGNDVLGRFSMNFLAAVKQEGSGRISPAGSGRPRYLNWSVDTGYWLDTAPRDARGSVLQPFVSAAADPAIPYVSTLELKNCGKDIVSSRAIKAASCRLLLSPTWIVRDRFSVGKVGNHVDLYVGEQDRADFLTKSPLAIHAIRATVTVRTAVEP